MQYIIYFMSFFIGIMLGSFFTLAVYRIPLKQNITYKRSYCPKCNHILNFLDLIPIASYILLKGKCRYCGEKIKIRYLIFEVISGLIFLLLTISFKIDIYNLEFDKLILAFIISLFVIGLIVIAGICKETKRIECSLIIYETLINISYMVYLCILKPIDIYIYAIYIFLILVTIFITILAFISEMKNKVNSKMAFITFYICVLTIVSITTLNFIYLK